MKSVKLLFIVCLLLSISCAGFGGSNKKAAVVERVQPQFYTYEVVESYPHKSDSYTQGLIFHEGRLVEGTGQVGESRILDVDLESGDTQMISELSGSHFGEGIVILGDTLYQLTWITNRLFMYDVTSGEKIGEKIYAGEGWGLTTDGEKLYMSNGSSVITVRDPKSFDIERRVRVTFNGQPLEYLNELEWIDGKIWANVYTLDQIAIIDPVSGVVEGVVELSGLLAEEYRTPTTDVLNGIAYDAQGDRIFVTGKNWSKLFEIKIIKQ
ncbi:MAG: glutaminyl-peptide cyclotransferase [Rikenellaceae bacterium]